MPQTTTGKLALSLDGWGSYTEGLRGPLPEQLSRARELQALLAGHQDLNGIVPALRSSLSACALHSNRFKVLSALELRKD